MSVRQPVFNLAKYNVDPTGESDSLAGLLRCQADAAASGRKARIVFPDQGRFLLSGRFNFTESGITWDAYGAAIVQGGSLGATDGSSLLRITGNDNRIYGLEVDGNVAAEYASRNRLIQINGTTAGTGTRNVLRDLYVHDSWNDASEPQTSDLIQIINGTNNLVELCRCENAGWNGIRVSGDGNRVERNWVIDYLGRGIRFNGGASGYVIGNYVSADGLAAGAALLTDPEDEQFGTWVCRDNVVFIKSNRVHAGSTGTNAIKVARTKHAVLSGNEVEIGLDSYSTGTVVYDHTGGANERQLTLTGGTWPTWAKSPGRIFINEDWYSLDTRVSDSIVTLKSTDNPGADVASTTFYAEQDYDNIGIRLEDANDHVEISGGRTDQILMTNGLMSGAITGHANNGSGKVRFTQTAHGWVSGDNDRIVYVTGSSVQEYNTKHIFTYVSANTWDSDQNYVAGTIGSAKAHGATDILTVRNVHFGRDKHTKLAMMENIKARVFDIEGCTFDGRHGEQYLDGGPPYVPFDPNNEGGANGAIEWAMPDNAYDLLRIVNNEFIGAHAGANCRLLSLDDETTQLITAGKMIAYNNRVRNIGTGGAALFCLTTSNASRALLFASDGERPTVWRGTAAPTAGTWAVGHTVWNSAPAVGQPLGWVCSAAGTPGTWTAMANL